MQRRLDVHRQACGNCQGRSSQDRDLGSPVFMSLLPFDAPSLCAAEAYFCRSCEIGTVQNDGFRGPMRSRSSSHATPLIVTTKAVIVSRITDLDCDDDVNNVDMNMVGFQHVHRSGAV